MRSWRGGGWEMKINGLPAGIRERSTSSSSHNSNPRGVMSRFISLIFFATVWLRADQVILTNGDRITGKVVKKDGGSLLMKANLFGDVTVKWENVQSIATTEPVAVALPGGETVRGTVETTGGQLRVAGPSGP